MGVNMRRRGYGRGRVLAPNRRDFYDPPRANPPAPGNKLDVARVQRLERPDMFTPAGRRLREKPMRIERLVKLQDQARRPPETTMETPAGRRLTAEEGKRRGARLPQENRKPDRDDQVRKNCKQRPTPDGSGRKRPFVKWCK